MADSSALDAWSGPQLAGGLLGAPAQSTGSPLLDSVINGAGAPDPSQGTLGQAAQAPQSTPAPQTATDPNQAAPAAPQPTSQYGLDPSIPAPLRPFDQGRNKIGDILDAVLLGGAVRHLSQSNYESELQARQNQIGYLQYQRAVDYIKQNVQDPQAQAAALADPMTFVKNVEARYEPRVLKAQETASYGPGQGSTTAGFFDDKSGKWVQPTPQGLTSSGTVGGDLTTTPSGVQVSSRFPGAIGSVPTIQTAKPGETISPMAPVPLAGTPDASPGAAPAASGGALAPLPTGRAPASAVGAAIRSRASAAGLGADDQNNLLAIGQLESGLNTRPKANGSSQGLFQFHPETFNGVAPGKDITNPTDQTDAAIALYKQNKAGLAASGLPVNPTTLYLAHQQGLDATRALLGADPQAKAVDTIAPGYIAKYGKIRGQSLARQAIAGNGGDPNGTVGAFLGGWGSRVQAKLAQTPNIGTPDGGPAPAPSAQGGGLPTSLSGKQPRVLSATEAQKLGYAPGSVVEQQPDGTLKTNQAPQWGAEQALSLRGKVQDSEDYKQANAAITAYHAMIGNSEKMTGPSAYSMLDTFARAINPGAVARPTVIETIEKNLGLPAQLVGSLESKFGNGNLPPQVRQQIIDAVVPFAQSHWDQAKKLNDANTEIATRHNLNPSDVTAPLEGRPMRHIIGDVPAAPQRQVGATYSTPKGVLQWTGSGWIKP